MGNTGLVFYSLVLAAKMYFCLRPQLHSPPLHVQVHSGLTNTPSAMLFLQSTCCFSNILFLSTFKVKTTKLAEITHPDTVLCGSLEYSGSSFQRGIVFNYMEDINILKIFVKLLEI